MFDTIALAHILPRPLTDHELSDKGFFSLPRRMGPPSIPRWGKNGPKDSGIPKLTYSILPRNVGRLQVECSIPRLLFGTNVNLPEDHDLPDFLAQITRFVNQSTNIQFDAPTAKVARVDCTRDFRFLHTPSTSIIKRFIDTSIPPNMGRVIYNMSTVEYRTQGKRSSKGICIYSKYDERLEQKAPFADLERSKGVIRFEVRLKAAAIVRRRTKRYLGTSDSTAVTLLNAGFSDAVLAEHLKLFPKSILDEGSSSIVDKMSEIGAKRAIRPLGFCKMLEIFGPDFDRNPLCDIERRHYLKLHKEASNLGILDVLE